VGGGADLVKLYDASAIPYSSRITVLEKVMTKTHHALCNDQLI